MTTTKPQVREATVGGLHVERSADADTAYVRLAEGKVYFTAELSDLCHLDYTKDGLIVGIEFAGVSDGVDLEGVPRSRQVAAVLRAVGVDDLRNRG